MCVCKEKHTYSNDLDYHLNLRCVCLCTIQIYVPLFTNNLLPTAFSTGIRSSKALDEIHVFTLLSSREFLILLPLNFSVVQ